DRRAGTAPQPPARRDAGADAERPGGPLRLGGDGAAHRHPLLHRRPQHRLQPQVPAQDALGPRKGGGNVPVHAPRTRQAGAAGRGIRTRM
ncbi:MAG: hypothetical protein AVDCRST_MAG89-5088, partial [uncultured Gemmatimonadetes bacterium]